MYVINYLIQILNTQQQNNSNYNFTSFTTVIPILIK